MLFLLTGDVQTGKTRWLDSLMGKLDASGYPVCGVVTPGIWVESSGSLADMHGFEKLGIDAVLLPQHTVIPFAKRRDIAMKDGFFDADSQSSRAGLGWEIPDVAIEQVNAHFDMLAKGPEDFPALLVVDELGRLELLNGKGFASAMALVDRGPMAMFPNALAVVRKELLSTAIARFCDKWGDLAVISPDDEGERLIWESL